MGRTTRTRALLRRRCILGITSILVLFCAAFNLVSVLHLESADSRCLQILFPWSPAFGSVKYEWKTYLEVGFIIDSVYLGYPSASIESEWRKLFPVHPISIPKARLSDLKYTDEPLWQVPAVSGSTVLAIPEVFVQLSCLNFLRRMSFRDSYDFSNLSSFSGSEDSVMERNDHCIERLRRAFMCWSDPAPLIMTRLDEGIATDLKTLHYCRNFDSILNWTRQNGIKDAVIHEDELAN